MHENTLMHQCLINIDMYLRHVSNSIYVSCRIEETENEKGKLLHQIKRKESQIQDLEQR